MYHVKFTKQGYQQSIIEMLCSLY